MSYRSLTLRAIALFIATALLVPFAALSTTTVANAHERRTVGKYTVVVGFNVEPAFADQVNAALITVTNAETSEPVAGVQQSLKVEVSQGGVKKEMPLTAVSGSPGRYIATFVPTKTGQYIFRFFGDIEGTSFDQTFQSGPGRFSDIESLSAIEFPARVATTETATQNNPQVQRQMASIETSLREAQDAASVARIVGFVGIVLGVAGLATAGLAMRRSTVNR